MDLGSWIPIATVAVALYGAILSTYNLIAARRDRAHRLKVSLKWGIAAPGPEPETMFILEANNPRGRPVTVTGCAISLPNGKSLVIPRPFGSVQLPCELAEGKNCTLLFPLRDVVRALVQEGFTGRVALRAEFRDALGNEYRSKAFKGDVGEWAKAG
jgi:hypothetical protein